MAKLRLDALLLFSSLCCQAWPAAEAGRGRASKVLHFPAQAAAAEVPTQYLGRRSKLASTPAEDEDVAPAANFRDGEDDVVPDDLPEGWICVKKVVMEEETVWDQEERCHHVAQQNCYQKFKTVFVQSTVQDCQTKFRKDCYITYRDSVVSKEVEVCNEEVRRDCDGDAADAEEVCETRYETVCETEYASYEVNEDTADCEVVKEERCEGEEGSDDRICVFVPKRQCTTTPGKAIKVVPRTHCDSVPKEVCGPEVCPIVKGDRKCRTETRHLVQEVPEEECDLVPSESCRDQVKIMPNLIQEEECVDVPKEVCVMEKVNPVKVQRPVIKRWCGPDPAVEGGGADGGDARLF